MRNVTTVALAVTVMVAALVMLIAAAAAGAAVKPKPWMWTTGQAASSLQAQPPEMFGQYRYTVKAARCSGVGKPVAAKRWVQFRCDAALDFAAFSQDDRTVRVWLKIRRAGPGQFCASLTGLAAVPAACMAGVQVRPLGSRDDADEAAALKLGGGSPYQGPLDCFGWGAGFYTCWFGSNDPASAGQASVAFTRTGSVVRVLSQPPAS